MSVDSEWLKGLIEEDEFGLLTLPVKTAPVTSHDRLVASFKEICAFIETHGRPPEPNPSDVAEFRLYHRLQGVINDPEQRAALAEYDIYGVLVEPEPPESLDEIFTSDALGILGEVPVPEIFTLRHVPAETAKPDKVAQRKPCKDFDRFEPLFKECHVDLKAGTRQLIEFRNGSQISAGSFFVQSGVLTYIAEVGQQPAARLRAIYENGTESDLLLLSLARVLYKNGRRVTDPEAQTLARMGLEADTATAVVYVLRSLSADPQVTAIPNLHKIGFTTGDTLRRIKNAKRAKTYLHAPVEIVAEYEMAAAIARRIEATLHKFFAPARLSVTYERNGVAIKTAAEWFSVPLSVIDEAISLLNAETITDYEYDRDSRTIRLRR